MSFDGTLALPDRRLRTCKVVRAAALAAMALLAAPSASADDALAGATRPPVFHRTAQIDGLEIFYREAGPKDAPAVLLLHGFPTSSHMFRNLIPALADRHRVVAPDYPGFGNSEAPSATEFAYTFDRIAEVMTKLTEHLGLDRYALYLMDYGAPVGFRLAVAHPNRVSALIVQNGNAYEEGLRDFWKPFRTYWKDPSASNAGELRKLLTLEATRWQYTHGTRDPARISPDNWRVDQPLLDRPGNQEIQLALFRDYGSNPQLYPKWQAYLRERQPPTLIVWGRNDQIFPAEGAAPYRRDLPKAELHLLDTGHFALEEDGDAIAALMRRFLHSHAAR
jgi:pimeloyl-ACP methyl ester carboxylesterase